MILPTLGYALLGLLARGPATGYAMSRRLHRPVGYFWSAGHSRIYPMLARLERNGLIDHTVVDGPGPRDTKEYSITPSGRAALAAWVASPPPESTERDEFMLRMWSGWAADPAEIIDVVRARRAEHLATLAEYAAIESDLSSADPTARSDPAEPAFWNLATLRRGTSFEKHAIRWCDDLIARLERAPGADDESA
jgi:DNA-binding PadR family transcriptional regulator